MSDMREPSDWHLDRKVTLSIIAALLLNTVSSVWWAAKLDYTVQSHENRLLEVAKDLDETRTESRTVLERLARIEALQGSHLATLQEIKIELSKRDR